VAEDVDPEAFDDLPTTGIEVERHVHYGMTGSFPLRMAEMFFADDGLYIAEYSYITPMFGLATRKHRREAASMERVFEIHGIDEVLLQADSVVWHSYDNLGEVVLYAGGRFGRPKIEFVPDAGTPQAYRIHADIDLDALADDLEELAGDHGFSFRRRSRLGFSPRESVRRFFR